VAQAVAKFKRSVVEDPISMQPVGRSRTIMLNTKRYGTDSMREAIQRGYLRVPHSRRPLTVNEGARIMSSPNAATRRRVARLETLARAVATVMLTPKTRRATAALRLTDRYMVSQDKYKIYHIVDPLVPSVKAKLDLGVNTTYIQQDDDVVVYLNGAMLKPSVLGVGLFSPLSYDPRNYTSNAYNTLNIIRRAVRSVEQRQ
jgi:hypothetical protein